MKLQGMTSRSRILQVLLPLVGGAAIAGISAVMMWLVDSYIR
jgi:hypothetical protein